jgi:hypothetical protein
MVVVIVENGADYVSMELWALIGPLSIPQMILE